MATRTKGGGVVTVLEQGDAGFERAFEKLCRRQQARDESVDKVVRKILEGVRENGDAEVLALTRKLDGASLDELEVERDEWDAGVAKVPAADRAALGKAAMRVREFHKKRIPASWEMREEGGAFMGHRVRALARVGIYVPGGVSPSSAVIMNAVPASVVEVPEILMATPPGADGRIRPEVLMAARVAGVHRVFKMGGAQAIAALAYGTQTVPRVDKIVGPGNVYVAEAKRQVFGQVGIDMIAGPSEILVIADGRTPADWVAMDLFSQAEHDEDAQAILLSPDKRYLDSVAAAIQRLIVDMPRKETIAASLEARGALIETRDLDEACALANRIAPEHLEISATNPEALVPKIRNAGAIFLGRWSSEAIGDYCAGPNHVLPTAGTARFSSPLGVYDFQKRTSIVSVSQAAAASRGKVSSILAEGEGLSAHARSARMRFE
jgi:histidinol dehydrogenase